LTFKATEEDIAMANNHTRKANRGERFEATYPTAATVN